MLNSFLQRLLILAIGFSVASTSAISGTSINPRGMTQEQNDPQSGKIMHVELWTPSSVMRESVPGASDNRMLTG